MSGLHPSHRQQHGSTVGVMADERNRWATWPTINVVFCTPICPSVPCSAPAIWLSATRSSGSSIEFNASNTVCKSPEAVGEIWSK